MPAIRSGTRKHPPPTAIRGSSPASVFIRSTASAIIAWMRETALRTSSARSAATPPPGLGGERRAPPAIAEVDETGRDRDVRGGELAAAEDESLLDEAVADA